MRIANRIGAFLLAGALAVLVFLIVAVRSDQETDDRLDIDAARAAEITDASRSALSALKDAETGQRGFLITGKESYLAPYYDGLRAFDDTAARLKRLTASDPDLSAAVSRVIALAELKRREMAYTIDLLRSKGREAAAVRVSQDIGKLYMDEIRMRVDRILGVEEVARARTAAEAARLKSSTRWKSLMGAAALFVLTLLGAVFLSIEIRYERRLGASLEASEKKYRDLAASLEQQIETRTRELKQLNAELSAFSYSVSHDLRAPLRSIDGFSQIFLEDYGHSLDEGARRLIERIRLAAARMGGLIQSLLDLARVTRQDLKREKVSISEIATTALRNLVAASPERRVRTIVAPGMEADADPQLIRIVLDNLISNAWKFTSKTPEAVIEVGRMVRAGKTVFFVRDNGAGFDPALGSRLFTPFQRLHPESEFEGTGIGLVTVQRIVERHGGKVWAESLPGHGATFSFALFW
jgi:signal transduction histidine kinase